MTTWPRRNLSSVEAMRSIVSQYRTQDVGFVLTLSKEEWNWDGKHNDYPSPNGLIDKMENLGVEVLWDEGNIMSHKKLMPTLEIYQNSTVIVVDDDVQQREGWLQTMIDDHHGHPNDIIYGNSSSVVTIIDDEIVEDISQRGMFTQPGKRTSTEKPANGYAGTLYPEGTFTDQRFFDREAYMTLSPTSDETWQWAWAVMYERNYRCLSKCNNPLIIEANQECALFRTNQTKYTYYHNAIAKAYPLYKERLYELIKNQEL